MNTPPKLTDEQINKLHWSKPMNEFEYARAIESTRDKQWLDMLAAAPGVERIMELAGEYAIAFAQPRAPTGGLQTVRQALRTAVEQALAARVPGMSEFLADLNRSRDKYPNNARMWDGLMGEVDELRRAYHGDGNQRAEAFDVAVCAFRIATEGDAGGNTLLDQSPLAARVPAGWKLVPVEPTEEMQDAMHTMGHAPTRYAAMLAAAPQPPQQAVPCPVCGGLPAGDNVPCTTCGAYPAPQQPAEKRPPNCGTGFCSCIECPHEQPVEWVGLTDDEIERGRHQIFSTSNPFCPCDTKTMRKAARWAEARLREKNGGGK